MIKNKTILIAVSALLVFLFIAVILLPVSKKPVFKKSAAFKGRIAIVIDDWGYHLENLAIIKEIKQPLTCAILPNLKNSAAVARKLHSFGFEIILHLPMEPKEKYGLEKNTVTTTMGQSQFRAILDQGLASIIFAKGVNNHMGSAVTEDKRASTMVISEVKRRNLYFLDSFVTARSVCSEIAKKIKVKFARRDVFLDNQNDPDYIRGQLLKLKEIASKQGVAIGIGHDRSNTLTVLKELLPGLENEGYRFVLVSEVAR